MKHFQVKRIGNELTKSHPVVIVTKSLPANSHLGNK